jgi:SH3-like domain-containing protein
MKKFALSCAISLAVAGLAHADVAVVAQAPVITSGHGTVTKDKVNIRARADKNAEIITQVNKGDAVEVLDRKGDWLHIALPATAKCYVSSKLVKDGQATADTVNIRCGPGTNFKDIGKLAKGEKVEVVDIKGEWTQIKPTSHCAGWIAAEFVEIAAPTPLSAPMQTGEIVTPPASLPPVETPPSVVPPPPVEVMTRYVVKDGYLAAATDPKAPAQYVLMTPTVSGLSHIIAYLDAPQMKLTRYEGKHIRVLGNERWKRDERYPVITVERLDMMW